MPQVIFGTGPAGRATLQALLQQGQPVRVVNRSGGNFPTGVEVMTGDVRDADFVRRATQDAMVVYQTLNAPYHRWPQDFPPLQRGLLDGLRGSGLRLVVLENLYLYGDTHGNPMHEGLPLKHDTRKGTVRAEMAAELRAAHEAGEVRVIQVRASDFIGPEVRDSGLGQHLMTALLENKALRVIGDPDQPHSMNYLPDLGRTLATLGQSESAEGRVWHAPCPNVITTREYLSRLAAEAELKPNIKNSPAWLLRLLGLLNPAMGEIPEMLYQWQQPFIMEHQAVEREFGLTATPWTEIIPATLHWWQQQLAAVEYA